MRIYLKSDIVFEGIASEWMRRNFVHIFSYNEHFQNLWTLYK